MSLWTRLRMAKDNILHYGGRVTNKAVVCDLDRATTAGELDHEVAGLIRQFHLQGYTIIFLTHDSDTRETEAMITRARVQPGTYNLYHGNKEEIFQRYIYPHFDVQLVLEVL